MGENLKVESDLWVPDVPHWLGGRLAVGRYLFLNYSTTIVIPSHLPLTKAKISEQIWCRTWIFYICTYLCNHCPDRDIEHLQYPRRLFCDFFYSILPILVYGLPKQALVNTSKGYVIYHGALVLPIFKLYIDKWNHSYSSFVLRLLLLNLMF